MVRRVALKGYRVAPVFTQEDFAELMEARLAIEPVNARLACERINQHGLAELGKAVENLKSAPRDRRLPSSRTTSRRTSGSTS
ncbi:gntr family protein [Arthrobacter sp. Hiyo4]|nr:gntr family protein [Arthrobacter sp. Hiyo4]